MSISLRKAFWGSYSGRVGWNGALNSLPGPVAASSAAPTGVGRPLSEPGEVCGMGMAGDRSDQKDEQLLEELLLEGLATPAEELSAETLEPLHLGARGPYLVISAGQSD